MLVHSPHDLALVVSNQRKKLKLSQSAVGDLVGLKQKTISSFENKPEATKVETMFLILSAVNLDMSISPKNEISLNEVKWKQEW